jgi:quinol monooxygenase YgiN
VESITFPKEIEEEVMIALFSRWKLKEGYPSELAAAVEVLTAEVREKEPGTLIYVVNLPGPHPPIGPPPDYFVAENIPPPRPVKQTDLVFFEVYEDASAFSAHLRGPVREFMQKNLHFFATPWQGHPRPEVTYLDPQSLFVRAAIEVKVATPA